MDTHTDIPGSSQVGIYVIGPDGGPYKIGMSSDPDARLTAIQAHSPLKLEIFHVLLVTAEIASEVEARAHRALRNYHSHGEWFSVDLMSAINAISGASVSHNKTSRKKYQDPRGWLFPDYVIFGKYAKPLDLALLDSGVDDLIDDLEFQVAS